jgi:hypothetical protein
VTDVDPWADIEVDAFEDPHAEERPADAAKGQQQRRRLVGRLRIPTMRSREQLRGIDSRIDCLRREHGASPATFAASRRTSPTCATHRATESMSASMERGAIPATVDGKEVRRTAATRPPHSCRED